MKRLILVVTLGLTFPCAAHAQPDSLRDAMPPAVSLHLVSWHDRGDFNNANLGVSLRWGGRFAAGGFYNSHERPSGYGGLIVPLFERDSFELELMAGMITGYSESGPLDLMAVPILGWRLSQRNALRLILAPRFVIPANVVHVMFERRLGTQVSVRTDRAP